MKNLLALLFASMILSLGVGCKSSKTSASSKTQTSFFGTYWRVETLEGKKVEIESGRPELYLTFSESDKSFRGNSGCNSLFGNFEQTNNKLLFSDIGMTKKACIGDKYESILLDALAKTSSFEIKGNQLFLKQDKEVLAILQAK